MSDEEADEQLLELLTLHLRWIQDRADKPELAAAATRLITRLKPE